MSLFNETEGVCGIRISRNITLTINNMYRRYKRGIFLLCVSNKWYAYGNYEVTGLSNDPSIHYDYTELPDEHRSVFDALSAKTVFKKDRVLRIRQNGPNVGRYYYVNGCTPLLTRAAPIPHKYHHYQPRR